MDTKRAYDDFYRLLENVDAMDVDTKLFLILQNYAKARLHDLVGEDIPVHLYYKEQHKIKKGNTTNIYSERFNPITGEICEKNWPHSTRAFHIVGEGIYVDFGDRNFKKQLKGYSKIYNLINFAFTVEHEAQHAKQYSNLSKGAASYNNLRYANNRIVLSFVKNQTDLLSQVFYLNAHNNLFLELDANEQAKSFVGQQIKRRGLSNLTVDNHSINFILEKRIESAHSGPHHVSYDLNMNFGLNNASSIVELRDNPEKIVGLLVDGLVRNNPNFYLSQYPILKHKYNSDGTKKTYFELKNVAAKKPELLPFYNQIIEDDNLLKIQKIESNMIYHYCNTNDADKRNQILDAGLNKIKKIIENEKIDIDNILVYLDKRALEIENNSNDINTESAGKLIFYMAKQAILRKDIIKKAYIKNSIYKEELLQCQLLLAEKCDLNFKNISKEKLYKDLDRLVMVLEHDWINKIYSSKGYSKEEMDKLIAAAKKYQKFLNNSGYILLDEETLSNEKSKGILPGYDNLYQTNYYKKVILNNKYIDEKVLLKKEFELINQMYIEAQKNVGITGLDPNTSAITFLRKSPIINKIISDNPTILQTLYKIREMEEKREYMTKLDALIRQCEEHLNKNRLR